MVHKEVFLQVGGEFLKTSRVHLTPIGDEDREWFFCYEDPTSQTADILGSLEERKKYIWESIVSEENISFMVWDNDTKEYAGYCQYKSLHTDTIDLGIELNERHRGKGLGFEICAAMIDKFFQLTGEMNIFYRVFRGNAASIRLVDKLGGVLVREELMAERFGDYFNDEDLNVLAEWDVLVYRIDRRGSQDTPAEVQ